MTRTAQPDTSPATDASAASELRSTGFGPTVFDSASLSPARAAPAASLFDVCHVGVVLRALLLVHAALAVGAMFAAVSPAAWMAQVAAGSGLALPAVLLWLLVACGLKAPLGRLSRPAQWLAAVALGALSGACGALVAWFPSFGDAGGGHWLAAPLAGAGLAAVMFQWLHLRAQATAPAEAAARLAELQSRIRPHFLFNTLNTALALARHDPARAEGLLEDLSELFRVALTEAGSSVTLGDEVELARRYLDIEQVRFGDRLKVSWELDDGAAAARLPPLVLQPLVENAVRHGVEPADGGGQIRVRTRVRMGRAFISIVNTVSDAPARPGNGLALNNVRERLRLMHDVAAQFDTRLEQGVFRVQIVVPL